MRDKFVLFMFNLSVGIYAKFHKQDPWQIDMQQLKLYPSGSLGCALKDFLVKNHFSLMENLENHDVMHVLTHTGVTVPDEISLQFYLLGNGKRSLYAFTSIFAGLLFYPEKTKFFRQRYRAGKSARPMHHVDFRNLLQRSIQQLRSEYGISCKPLTTNGGHSQLTTDNRILTT